MPIDKACGLWYNKGGAGRAAHGGQGPFSRSYIPYAKILRLLAGFPKTRFFPKFKATHALNAPAATEAAGIPDYPTPYAKFLRLLAAFICAIFSRKADRSSTKNRESPRMIRHMALETNEIASIIASPDFLCGQGFDNTKKICYNKIKRLLRRSVLGIWI